MGTEEISACPGGVRALGTATGWRPPRPVRFALFLIVLATIAASFACSSNAGSGQKLETGTTPSTDKKGEMPTSVSQGKQLYQQHCVSCHGPQGDRMPVAPLNAKEFLETRGDATLLMVVNEGKGSMPAWGKVRGGPLSETQVESVVAYLNFAAGRDSSSVLAGQGQQYYASTCLSCHGEKGDRIPIAPLNVKGFLDSRTNESLSKVIAEGKGQMTGSGKAKGGNLSDEQIKAIISYLRHVVESNVAASATRGREIYVNSCLTCHGERGDRISAAPLASVEFLRSRGDGRLVSVVGEGTSSMPGFGRGKGGSLDPTDVGAVLAYLKAWSGTSASSAIAITGGGGEAKDLFTKNCSPCHGDGGDKVAGVQLRSKAFIQQKGDALLAQAISRGNAKGMPAWGKASGGPFSDEQISSLVTYLKSSAADSGTTSPSASGATPTPQPAANPTPAANTGGRNADQVAKGKDVFTKYCVACHGATRDRVPTCKLTDKDWVTQKGEAGLIQSIANGKGGMPAWSTAKGGQLSEEEIKASAAYLLDAVGAPSNASPPSTGPTSSGGGANAELAAKGKDVFAKNCVMCHGETRDKVATCKLTDKDWVSQKGEAGLVESIANGKGPMPAWSKAKGGQLSDEEIKATAAYLLNAVGAASGTSTSNTGSGNTGGGANTELVAKGKDIFAKNCVMCHGDTRDKVATCKLTDKDWVGQRGEAGLIQSISDGKGPMPAWSKAKGGQLSDEEIKATAAYLLDAVKSGPAASTNSSSTGAATNASSTNTEPSVVNAATGKELYKQNCVMCHGEDGLRQPVCRLGSKSFVEGKGAETLTLLVTNGKPGMGMPAWGKEKGGQFGPKAVASIVEYVFEMARQNG